MGRILSILLLTAAWFCVGCHTYRTIDVAVTDVETGAPVPGTIIDLAPYKWMRLFPPPNESFAALDNGVAHVKVPSGMARWNWRADGYVRGVIHFDDTTVAGEHNAFISRPNAAAGRLTLWRAPEPRLVVVIPDGYAGLVQVQNSTPPGIKLAVGERAVRVEVNGQRVSTVWVDGFGEVPQDDRTVFVRRDGSAIDNALRASPAATGTVPLGPRARVRWAGWGLLVVEPGAAATTVPAAFLAD
jgi:hypothetical protein